MTEEQEQEMLTTLKEIHEELVTIRGWIEQFVERPAPESKS